MKVHDGVWVLIGFAIALPVPHLVGKFGGTWDGASTTLRSGLANGLESMSSSPTVSGASLVPPLVVLPRRGPRTTYKLTPELHFCNKSAPYPEKYPAWDIVTPAKAAEGAAAGRWELPKCHFTDMYHPGVPMRPLNVCTHDPAQDGVISTFLHTYHFWGGPDDYNLLLAMGPCTAERPYMLDIGANLGVYTILGASRGCRSVSFEPLSQNILRLSASLQASGWAERALLFKHAVGKLFTSVKIGFRPFNPGASAIGVDGAITEHMEQITIDGLLHGPNPPKFPDLGPDQLPVIGKHINFIKIDTEGYDVAVVDGMLKTIVEGCNPFHFVQFMYAAGYRMYEGAKAFPLKPLLQTDLPMALAGKGRRVFECWFIHDDAAADWMAKGLLQRYSPGSGGSSE